MQLAGVPDQVPSARHSLMLLPLRSNSGRHRTPQAASKWLLQTFWIKKPFSGGGSAGQYTTETKAEKRTAAIDRKEKRKKDKNGGKCESDHYCVQSVEITDSRL